MVLAAPDWEDYILSQQQASRQPAAAATAEVAVADNHNRKFDFPLPTGCQDKQKEGGAGWQLALQF